MNIQLWDIPGHERFGGLTRVHYKYAHGALIVFDLSRPEETFDTALSWLSDVTQKLFDERPNEEEVVDDDAVSCYLLTIQTFTELSCNVGNRLREIASRWIHIFTQPRA